MDQSVSLSKSRYQSACPNQTRPQQVVSSSDLRRAGKEKEEIGWHVFISNETMAADMTEGGGGGRETEGGREKERRGGIGDLRGRERIQRGRKRERVGAGAERGWGWGAIVRGERYLDRRERMRVS